MFGRSTTCLLLVLLFALTQSMEGQSDRVFSPDVAAPAVHVRLPISLEERATAASQFPRVPVAPGTFGLPQFAGAAGTIFSGTVTRIERHAATSAQPVEIVSISFHVERAIRGATAGEEITISQWIGLWSAGQRYRVGERVLLFLYPRSKLGLTSCVGRRDGAFHCRLVGPRLALGTTSFGFPYRSRAWREVARSAQRFRLGGATGRWGGISVKQNSDHDNRHSIYHSPFPPQAGYGRRPSWLSLRSRPAPAGQRCRRLELFRFDPPRASRSIWP